MNLEPLYELKERLENIAIAGVSLLKEDFRLKKAIEQIKPYTEVAKIFQQIYTLGEKLISTDNEDSCNLLLDLLSVVDAVLCTQAGTISKKEVQEIENLYGKSNSYFELPYQPLNAVISSLTETGSGRYQTIVDI